MNASRILFSVILLSFILLPVAAARGADTKEAAVGPLVDVAAEGAEKRLTPTWGSEEQVSVARSQDKAAPGLVVTIKPGKAAYPGVNLKPEGGAAWDLSAFGHVEAHVVNTGEQKLGFSLRVDNEGDWKKAPWNTEMLWLKPGESGTVTVIFGYQYGHKPGFALKPDAVVNIGLFATKNDAAQSFRVESLAAGGTAGEKPAE